MKKHDFGTRAKLRIVCTKCFCYIGNSKRFPNVTKKGEHLFSMSPFGYFTYFVFVTCYTFNPSSFSLICLDTLRASAISDIRNRMEVPP